RAADARNRPSSRRGRRRPTRLRAPRFGGQAYRRAPRFGAAFRRSWRRSITATKERVRANADTLLVGRLRRQKIAMTEGFRRAERAYLEPVQLFLRRAPRCE